MMHSILTFVLAWYNLPFTILLMVCLLLAALQWMGLGGDHEADGDAEVDASADLDGDVDFDADADVDVDTEVDTSIDGDADVHGDHDMEHEGGETGLSILAYLGVGRAPLMVILLLLFGSVGLLGWLFNGLVTRTFGIYPGLLFGVVLVLALVGGSLISARAARAIGQALPPISTTATPAHGMVGLRGTVISPFVDARYGQVHLRDAGGTLISVFATSTEEPPIRRGESVILVHYDPASRLYEVARTVE